MRNVKIKCVVVLMLLLAFVAGFNTVLAKKPPPDYFPMAKGYWWKYQIVEKKTEFTIKVAGTEKVGDHSCFKLDTVAGNDKHMFSEYYSKTPGKILWPREVYVTAKRTVDFKPPRIQIHNPLKIGDTWSWKGKGMMGIDIEDSAKVLKTEKVTVPAGTFNCVVVQVNTVQGGANIEKTYWYAPNVGMVKSVTKTSAFTSNVVLTKYNLKKK